MTHQLFVLTFMDRISPSLVCTDTEGPYRKAYLDLDPLPGKVTADQAECVLKLNPRMWVDICHVCQAELDIKAGWRWRNI